MNNWCLESSRELQELFDQTKNILHGMAPWRYYYPSDYNNIKGSWETIPTSHLLEKEKEVITFTQFKQLQMNYQKRILLGVPVILGKSHHLQAFMKDCENLGYIESSICPITHDSRQLKLNGNTTKSILANQDHFEILVGVNKNCVHHIKDTSIVTFQLPNQWEEALKFMEENMEIWKELQIPDFKVGDWVVFNVEKAKEMNLYTNFWNKSHILKIDEINNNSLSFNNSNLSNLSNHIKLFRLATPVEIESVQPKIFKMTSSSGDFELKVCKKGIYYAPEKKWLNLNFFPIPILNDLTTDTPFSLSYPVNITKIDVGCKKDTLVSDWNNVYDYYNSIK